MWQQEAGAGPAWSWYPIAQRLTDDCEDAVGLCRPKGVGDLTDVGATVLSTQVTDGQPCDTLSPAAVSREGPAIFEPADGRDGVARGSTG